jgi:hypothetical protein
MIEIYRVPRGVFLDTERTNDKRTCLLADTVSTSASPGVLVERSNTLAEKAGLPSIYLYHERLPQPKQESLKAGIVSRAPLVKINTIRRRPWESLSRGDWA